MGRNVVVDMRIRVGASCAFLAVLGGTLSACSLGDDGAAPLPEGSAAADTAASAPAAVDPWTLPIEDRPELFNPCTEISLEDLAAAGLENPTPWPEADDSSEDPPFRQCGWKSANFTLSIGSLWTPMDQLSDGFSEEITSVSDIGSYVLGTLERPSRNRQMACGVAAETNRGLITLDAIRVTTESNAVRNDQDTCESVTDVFIALSASIPEPRS
ncbi:DUF3558 family protein [Dietzia timorensis]|uniref:DUF3558 domain-containing protein n=1 Tax=Dietzia timorensis TaxID=499555 RepID=A0A173LLT9_9ACTN|nr:DUF3558 family protein [Dietzia timorensis]ANI91712.1 Hypothetical protein BJL86_0919 [Dietzia timorensis]